MTILQFLNRFQNLLVSQDISADTEVTLDALNIQLLNDVRDNVLANLHQKMMVRKVLPKSTTLGDFLKTDAAIEISTEFNKAIKQVS